MNSLLLFQVAIIIILFGKIILVKLGGIDNTVEELNNTKEVFSKVISDYIKEI